MVHYCSRACQKRDWNGGSHKRNCSKYQVLTKLREQGDSHLPDGAIALMGELREGRIPLAYALEHPATARIVLRGILDVYKIVNRHTGQRLTHEMNDSDEKLTHKERSDIILSYLYDWLSDLGMTNPIQLERALAKSEAVCHMCGKEGSKEDSLEQGGLMPDRSWAFVKNLCLDCYTRTAPQPPPDKEAMDWEIVAFDPQPTPSHWKF
jgi:hypothetical protein